MDASSGETGVSWKTEYFGYLNRPRRSDADLEAARLLKEKNQPTLLYKYADFNSVVTKEWAKELNQDVEGQPWTLVNLLNRVVALRPPQKFNDPFDSSLYFVGSDLLGYVIAARGKELFEGSQLADVPDVPSSDVLPPPKDGWEEGLQASWRKMPKELGPYARFKEIMGQVIESINDQAIEQFVGTTRDALRVTCFPERNDSMLMWSHYADHHRGICIEYETWALSIPGGLGFLHPVNYHPELF